MIRGVAYIAGPYRSANGKTVLENIRAAEQLAIKWWRAGFAVICPHLNTAFFDGLCDDAVWLEGDLEFVRRSDVVVMASGWRASRGAVIEHDLAKELGKKIVYEAEGE